MRSGWALTLCDRNMVVIYISSTVMCDDIGSGSEINTYSHLKVSADERTRMITSAKP